MDKKYFGLPVAEAPLPEILSARDVRKKKNTPLRIA